MAKQNSSPAEARLEDILENLSEKISRLPEAVQAALTPDLELLRKHLQDQDTRHQGLDHAADHKRAEAEREELLNQLAAERRQLEEILDWMPIGVMISDAHSGKILFKNRQGTELYRQVQAVQSVEEFGPWQAFHTDGTPYTIDQVPMTRSVRCGEVVQGEEMKFLIHGKDWVILNVNSAPIYDAGGRIRLGVMTMEDITAKRAIEEALRKSEEKFAKVFRSSPIALAISTIEEGRYIDINDSYLDIFGYTREEIIGHTSTELGIIYHPEDRKEIIRLFREGGGFRNVELKCRAKNGEARYAFFSTEPIEISGNVYMLSTIMNITERKRAEAALNERNEALQKAHNELISERNRLLAVMDALPIGLAIYDMKGGVILANQAFEAVWGSPRPPANSVDDYDLYKAWWVETGQRVLPEEWAAARAVQDGETVTGQYIRIQKFDGSQGFILNSGAPVRDVQGQIIGGAVAILDITERVRAEKALQESMERFRVALASVPLLVYTCDRDQRYTWVYNPLQGFHGEDVLGKRDDEILPDGAGGELIAAKQLALDTGQGGVQEVKVPFNGKFAYYILTTEPIKDTHGNVTGLTCSAIDITSQKQLEIEQQENVLQMEVQRRLLDYREKERQEIARDLHDGPIQLVAATIFHLQAAKEAAQDPVLKLEIEQAALNLKGAVRELRSTMNELRPPAIIRFGLAKTARVYAEDFREKHPEIKLTLYMFDDDQILPETMRLALYRIYQESLNNIVKHAHASKTWVRFSKKDNVISLQIHDNGQGFSVPKDLIGQTELGHYGLAGMKERAEAIGGEFMVSSEPGQGTTILVTVPILEE